MSKTPPPENLKKLLYKKLNLLQLEIDPLIVENIKMTVDAIFEYYEDERRCPQTDMDWKEVPNVFSENRVMK